MKYSLPTLAAALLLVAAFSFQAMFAAPKDTKTAPHRLWVTAYYPVWVQEAGVLTPEKIDYSAFSHLVHFGVVPTDNGTIDPVKGGITPAESAAVVAPAHEAGRKVLLSVGGWLTAAHFRAAYSDLHRSAFISSLIQLVQTRGYDGLDIDMEPLLPTDAPGYETFVRQLRAQMTAANPKLLLTAATAAQPEMFARLSSQFDQINLMTYDLAGPWQGFKTWHNSALYGDGTTPMNPGQPFPSASGMAERFAAAGVPKAKLGLGIAFYGCVWSGANGPTQSIQGVTMDKMAYSAILDQYDKPGAYHWDAVAHAPYFSVGAAIDPARKFVSFDDTRLAREKVQYARTHGLGGVIIWELGGGYRDSQSAGQKDALLQAVKRAARGPLPAAATHK